MSCNNLNDNFLGWNGTINRKNYIINMLIITTILVLLSFVRFEVLQQFIKFQILFVILTNVVELLKFILIICMLSLIYRRTQDISKNRPYTFSEKIKKAYIIIYIIPIVYFYGIRILTDSIPVISGFLNMITILIFFPIGLITAIVLGIIKGK